MKNTTNKRISKLIVGISLSLLMAVSGTMVASPQAVHAAAATGTSVADNVIATGKQFLGVRYQFGATAGRTDAFDCSSFTQYVFKQNGIDLPRSSRQQATVGTAVQKSDLKPGDLVFSDTNHDGKINHVSIYMGNDQLLHTYRVGIGVTISKFTGSTWDRTFVTARRVINDNGQGGGAVQQPANDAPQPAKETTPPEKAAPQPAHEAPQPSEDRHEDISRHADRTPFKHNGGFGSHKGTKETHRFNDWFDTMFFNMN